jgi:glycosyltransferase involved in cell wall biosynthesis
MINILIRTSKRPKCFNRCIESIKSQTYKDWNTIVGNDNNDNYCSEFNPVRYPRTPIKSERIGTARHFPYNAYLNKLFDKVTKGWVLILDDDDQFVNENSLATIAQQTFNEDNFIHWLVDLNFKVVPQKPGKPQLKDTSMIGFCFHSKYLPLLHVAPYKQADFRIAHLLYEICQPIWVEQILTKIQGNEGMGRRIDF